MVCLSAAHVTGASPPQHGRPGVSVRVSQQPATSKGTGSSLAGPLPITAVGTAVSGSVRVAARTSHLPPVSTAGKDAEMLPLNQYLMYAGRCVLTRHAKVRVSPPGDTGTMP